ncbi:MAG: hypothetical protein PHO09_06670 [Sphaerochaeta sp.]|nr:hypothetical protein [Sphaerochaeta sp.]
MNGVFGFSFGQSEHLTAAAQRRATQPLSDVLWPEKEKGAVAHGGLQRLC